MKKKNKILAISSPTPTRENQDIKSKRTKWIPFFKGSSNIYINDLALRYRRTATLQSIINSKTNYSIGNDFSFTVNKNPLLQDELPTDFSDFLDISNLDMQGLREVVKDGLFDWIWSGNLYLNVIFTRHGNQSSKNITVIDASKCRIDTKQKNCFVSAHWRDIKDNESFNAREYPVKPIPLWNGKKDTKQTNFVIHIKRKVPEFDFYGLPDYISTLKDCDIEYKVDSYNLDRLENGFFPSVSFTQVGSPPEGLTPTEYAQKIKTNFTGEGKSGKMVVQLVDDKDSAPLIHEFSGTKEGEFIALEDSATKGIIKGSRFFPQLAGIETVGKLGGSQDLINQWNIVMQNVITPDYQEPVLKVFNLILKIFGFDVKIGIINKPPIPIEVKADDVLEVNEKRELLGFSPLEKKL